MDSSSRLKHVSTTLAIYLGVILAAVSLASVGMRAQSGAPAAASETTNAPAGTKIAPKPAFSLSTNHTYASTDRARIWINYQSVDHLDFRVYRVKDPVKFFRNLNDPHQMGEREKTEAVATFDEKPTALEKVHSFKTSLLGSIRNYFRRQLRHETRETFVQKFNSEGDRLPLNVADYARVPLLNSDQLVGAWREALTPLENEFDSRSISLGKREPGVYLVEAVNEGLRAYTIAISTDLALVNKTSRSGEALIYAVDRKSGAPRAGAAVEIVRGKKTLAKGVTDNSGMLRTHVEPAKPEPAPAQHAEDIDPEANRSDVGKNDYLIMATDHDQFAISDLEPFYFGAGAADVEGDEGESEGGGDIVGYIYADRPVYRPGQKVYFKAVLRRMTDNGYQLLGGRSVNVTVQDPNGANILQKSIALSAKGTLSGDVDIAAGAPLGGYSIEVSVDRQKTSGYFEVQEYKKPEYKVSVSTGKPFIPVGDKATFTIAAQYFFGSPVTKADVKYYIYRTRYYHFWGADDSDGLDDDSNTDDQDSGGYGFGSDLVKDGDGHVDAGGKMTVDFKVPPPEKDEYWDYTYRLEAQVTDSARHEIEGKASFVGTRGNVVAVAEPERFVYNQGDEAKITVQTADYQGHPVSAKVSLKYIQRTWDRTEKEDENGHKTYEYKMRETELGSGEVSTDGQGKAVTTYKIPVIGSVYIKTIVADNGKQVVSTGGYLWAADPSNKWSDFAYEDYSSIKLVPDKKTYQPGETAHVMAMLPTDKAHLLVTTEVNNIMTARQVDAAGIAVMLDVPIEARYAPNVYLSVTYVKDGDMYTHDQSISVPARNKFLNLEIMTNKKEYKPQEAASYTVLARNTDGTPAPGAEISLGVVDEAVYSIRGEATKDIRKAFYGRRYNQVQTQFSTSFSFAGFSGEKSIKLAATRAAYQLADFKNDQQYQEPKIRKDFKDTAFWKADLVTGADGKATASFNLPDNLTTWRATARAVTADCKVGASVAKVVARKDLILRMETPRFLTEGDTVTLSGIVHNYLDSDKVTEISIDVTGARLAGQPVTTVTIPKQGEYRVDWQVTAGQIGSIRLLAKAKTNAESDGVEMPLEVVPVGLKHTDGQSLALPDDSADKTVRLDLPASANPMARTLHIEVAPSIAGTLFGALDYLTSYPYGCTEQTMSSFLPNVIVTQALKEVKTTSLRSTNDLPTKVQRGLDRLYDYQHEDGGWGWWKNDKSDPYMSAYVIDGLTLAAKAGYKIDAYRVKAGRDKLKKMLDTGKTEDNKSIDPETRAYMVYAYVESGDSDPRLLGDLFNRRGELQPYGRALLGLALKLKGDDRARQVASDIENSARSDNFDAHWESRRNAMLDFPEANDVEATALSLKALSRISPSSPLLARAARWLVANRRYGYYWESTKQTAFAIMGLVDYLKVSKELNPDYSVEVFLNGQSVLTHRMTPADAASGFTATIERKGSDVGSGNQLRIVKQGNGVLYLAATVSYYSMGADVQPQGSADLSITREYMRLKVVEKSEGKSSWSLEPLTGEVHSGDLIVSRLHVKGARAQYMMIEDPIPAGCEQIEQISGISLDYNENKWSDWYSNREFRDQKTVLFVNYFSGDSTFQYAMQVVAPGQFKAAPARAELMYKPAVEANTATTQMQILDRR